MTAAAWPQGYGKAHPVSGKAYGRLIGTWSGTISNSQNTYAIEDDTNDGATKKMKLTQHASTSFAQLGSSYTSVLVQAPTNVGIWYKAPTLAAPRQFELRLFNAAGSRTIIANMVAEPTSEWRFAIAQSQNWAGDTLIYGTDGITNIRVTQQAATASGWSDWASGEYVDFGNVYIGARTRPKFLLFTDDGYAANVTNGTGFPTSYPASGGNYLDICTYYGFRATATVIPSLIGTATYMTWANVATLAAAGWSIASHSASNDLAVTPGGGVTGIRAGVQADMDAIAARYPTNAGHYTLPGGAWTDVIRDAVMGVSGLKTVRGISSYNNGSHAFPVGVVVGGGNTGSGSFRLSGWIDLPSSVQVDGALSAANIQAYVDEVIRQGATGTCYTHSIGATIATAFDALCAYLKRKQQQGLIDVVTIEDWHQGLTQPALVA